MQKFHVGLEINAFKFIELKCTQFINNLNEDEYALKIILSEGHFKYFQEEKCVCVENYTFRRLF